MSEPAEVMENTSTGLARDSDQFFKKENLKLVGLEKGLKFFKGQCIVRIANRLELRQKAYELIHYLYAKKGFTRNKDSDVWLSIYDALPETTTFVVEDDQGCIEGALTAVFDSPIGLPADQLYQEEIDVLRNSGGQICEFVSLGIRSTVKSPLKILTCLFYCAYLLAWRIRKSTDLVVTVNPSHENFYRRKLLFNEIGPERNYARVNGAPSVLLNVPLILYSRLEHKHRIFPLYMLNYSDIKEIDLANKIKNMLSPISDEEFYTFFIEKTDIWELCSQQQKDFIKKIYPAYEANHYEISRAFAKGFSKKTASL
jgi:hypothetical protein